MDALERENRELTQSRNDERTLAMSLREDLINERMKSVQLKDTMEELHMQIKKMGFDPNKLDTGILVFPHFVNFEKSTPE